MADEKLREVYRAHQEAQSKYTYFVLAAAGAGIGLAVNQTRDAAMGWLHAPLGAAVVAWGLSFYFGCRHLRCANSILTANIDLLRVQTGQYPWAEADPRERVAAESRMRADLQSQIHCAAQLAGRQFRYLVTGGVLYVVWHAWEMYLRRMTG
jgi:hypothetical protein